MTTRAYHFVGKTLSGGTPVPVDGEWLVFHGKPKPCQQGLHASLHPADALKYAPGNTICLVELDGDIDQSHVDKLCATRRRIVARFDATELLRADARASALSVIHLWEAPPVVRQYLETGDESLRVDAHNATSAAYAAGASAASAATSAAYAAAPAATSASYAAAYAAAYAANAAAYAASQNLKAEQRARLLLSVTAEFKKLGVL